MHADAGALHRHVCMHVNMRACMCMHKHKYVDTDESAALTVCLVQKLLAQNRQLAAAVLTHSAAAVPVMLDQGAAGTIRAPDASQPGATYHTSTCICVHIVTCCWQTQCKETQLEPHKSVLAAMK